MDQSTLSYLEKNRDININKDKNSSQLAQPYVSYQVKVLQTTRQKIILIKWITPTTDYI